jgi:uncharacterized protein DUF4314
VYEPGQRIELVHTTDRYTDLRPGAQGTVQSYQPSIHTLNVDWDSGSRLSMLFDQGDEVRAI